jgi:hypothetical protein
MKYEAIIITRIEVEAVVEIEAETEEEAAAAAERLIETGDYHPDSIVFRAPELAECDLVSGTMVELDRVEPVTPRKAGRRKK